VSLVSTVICSVYDSKAAAYLQPFFAPTRAVAIRSFAAACLQEDHQFRRHAEDYTLFCLAEFDEFTGQVFPLNVLEPLTNGLTCKAIKEAN